MENNYLSIDIGGTNVKFAEINNLGQIIEKDKVKTKHDKLSFLNDIDQIVEKYVQKDINGIAFCAPGKITDTQIHFGGALLFLDGIDFAQRYNKYKLPVAVINDGKASALAENWLGSLKGSQNCAAITLGTGVGGGIIVDGRLLKRTHSQAGEVCFLQLNLNGDHYYDGFAGLYASAVQMIKKINKELNYPDLIDGLNAFAAIKDNNPKAIEIFKEFCKRVATVIINIQAVVDLGKIAIRGGISAQPEVVKGINEAYDEIWGENDIIKNTYTRPQIVEARFKNDANLYGALYNLLLNINGEQL